MSRPRIGATDLRIDPWIPGFPVADVRARRALVDLKLDVHRPCSVCGKPCWLHRRELVDYDRGVPLLCPRCVGDAFAAMPTRRGRDRRAQSE